MSAFPEPVRFSELLSLGCSGTFAQARPVNAHNPEHIISRGSSCSQLANMNPILPGTVLTD